MARQGAAPQNATAAAPAQQPPAAAVQETSAAAVAPIAPATPAVAPVTPASAASSSGPLGNVLANGSLDEGDLADGKLAGWYIAERCLPQVKTLLEGGDRFVRLTNTDPATTAHVDQKIDLDPAWRALTVSARIRAFNFKAGKASSGVTYSFQDDDGKTVGKFPPALAVKEDTAWVERTVTADIPKGATKLYLQCVVSYTRGTMDFDDVKVVPQR
jgi:hypothetical protein